MRPEDADLKVTGYTAACAGVPGKGSRNNGVRRTPIYRRSVGIIKFM